MKLKVKKKTHTDKSQTLEMFVNETVLTGWHKLYYLKEKKM